MTGHPFRFGVVSARAPTAEAWTARARRIEDLGFSTLLIPDRLNRVLSPIAALAALATTTRTLRLGTFVLACGLRNPAVFAWDAATVDFLSDGRFELGLGTGVSEDDFRQAGLSYDSPGARIERLAETIRIVKAHFASHADGASSAARATFGSSFPPPVQRPHPPILVAGAGPRLLALAGREADIVALGVRGDAGEPELAEKVAVVRRAAGERFASIELSLNLLAIAQADLAPGVRERIRAIQGVELDQLVRSGSPFVLSGTPDAMAERLQQLRERLSVSYVTISEDQMEALAPVVERLAGR